MLQLLEAAAVDMVDLLKVLVEEVLVDIELEHHLLLVLQQQR